MDMVVNLSDDIKDDLLGIDNSILSRIESWKGAIQNVTSSTNNETKPKIDPQPASGASFLASMATTIYVDNISCLLL